MHRRPSAAVAPLPALSLPPRSREMSALISGFGSTPHTPTKRAEPLPLFVTNTNRYSTDSWNSSNFDGASEMEVEWKPEQIRLLTRTLDALPSHLLTPFNGSIPPSNLLDKIARGVAEAKGTDWPHSMRATRAKIVELARMRARNSLHEPASDTIAEEDCTDDAPLQQTTNIGLKRPLYRQSSMDFMQSAKINVQDNSHLSRLSRRLQKTERVLTSPTYKLYGRSSSPSRGHYSLNPSTPSSSTLNSGISDTGPSRIRRSMSSLSSASDQPIVVSRRMRRSETFTGSSLRTPGIKRAPSFGSSRNSLESAAMSIDFNAKNSDATSSDEEEKLRSQNAKRARRKAASPTPTAPPALPTSSSRPATRSRAIPKTPSKPTSKIASNEKSTEQARTRTSKAKADVQRKPNMFGGELPNPQPNLELPAVSRLPRPSPRTILKTPASPAVPHIAPSSPCTPSSVPPMTPSSQVVGKTSRRSRPTAPLPRASLGRKISFGNLLSPQDENTRGGLGSGLGSAFQLH
ncbi:hypothetical protein PHLGIDRAFT_35343 [Phlebiopsis gigantea 11061_1 CR5-6]|uniref:Uncharacterized protein n=1 Tax=Phlebiopsis gigantea (strain 11061_1 CR5-6) TaxID=745531 RepID=A0A0C3SB53_PHLG1|nr:hypothetical protein PHLGIDRAFT_35343 [Phlebiopsis gigantea 11061_1 CR5-6]